MSLGSVILRDARAMYGICHFACQLSRLRNLHLYALNRVPGSVSRNIVVATTMILLFTEILQDDPFHSSSFSNDTRSSGAVSVDSDWPRTTLLCYDNKRYDRCRIVAAFYVHGIWSEHSAVDACSQVGGQPLFWKIITWTLPQRTHPSSMQQWLAQQWLDLVQVVVVGVVIVSTLSLR